MKIGRYKTPLYRLSALIEPVETIYEKYKDDEIDDMEALARLLGHKSSKSGAFGMKLASMRSYRLIEGRGYVRVTSIGSDITRFNPDDRRKQKAKNDAVLSIPLWQEFYSNFPEGLPKEQFWADLGRITGAAPPDAQTQVAEVRNAYLEDMRYFVEPKEGGEKEVTTEMGMPGALRLDLGPYGGVWLPEESKWQSWHVVKRAVDAIEKEETKDKPQSE